MLHARIHDIWNGQMLGQHLSRKGKASTLGIANSINLVRREFFWFKYLDRGINIPKKDNL